MTDDITTGELGRRLDEVRDTVRELVTGLAALENRFVPRREIDERQRLVDAQLIGLETEIRSASQALDTYKREVAMARRWAVPLILSTILTLAGVLINFVGIYH